MCKRSCIFKTFAVFLMFKKKCQYVLTYYFISFSNCTTLSISKRIELAAALKDKLFRQYTKCVCSTFLISPFIDLILKVWKWTHRKNLADGFMGCAKCREQKIQFEKVVTGGVVKPDAPNTAIGSAIWCTRICSSLRLRDKHIHRATL